MAERERGVYAGFIRLHILHHAAEGEIFGLGIIEELRRHGYNLSPGTLYPILHRMEELGQLKALVRMARGHRRVTYRITNKGLKTLVEAKARLKELFGELFEKEG
jgi:PadR family transcriptional regulator PadR